MFDSQEPKFTPVHFEKKAQGGGARSLKGTDIINRRNKPREGTSQESPGTSVVVVHGSFI